MTDATDPDPLLSEHVRDWAERAAGYPSAPVQRLTSDGGAHLGTTWPASPEAVATVLNAPLDDDGRSGWEWLRLSNGDLALVCWPMGDTYCAVEQAVEADYHRAAD